MNLSVLKRSLIIFLGVGVIIFLIMSYKSFVSGSAENAGGGYEPMEAVTVAVAEKKTHRKEVMVVGTVVARRSISLRNELPGTVAEIGFELGEVVEKDTVLVALDVSVELAELKAQEARSALAKTTLARSEKALESQAISEIELERAKSEFDITLAEIARSKAIIERKTMRAPFRAKVGITDVHVGQYLQQGTLLTTLQDVSDTVYVDFAISQQVAKSLKVGDVVETVMSDGEDSVSANIIAIDSRINPATRHATVRSTLNGVSKGLIPGTSVRVRVPAGELLSAVSVPATALRKGPSGDHVFVITPDEKGQYRAQMRRVQSGAMVGRDVLIYEGLTGGEKVAASGSFKLREGSLVGPAE